MTDSLGQQLQVRGQQLALFECGLCDCRHQLSTEGHFLNVTAHLPHTIVQGGLQPLAI